MPFHRPGRSRGSDTREGDNGNQRWQCDLHGEPLVWPEPLTPAAERLGRLGSLNLRPRPTAHNATESGRSMRGAEAEEREKERSAVQRSSN